MDQRPSDKEILDFLQEQTDNGEYTGKVIFRWSGCGRGWRLHETSRVDAVQDVRQAIVDRMPVKTEADMQRAWREGLEEGMTELEKEVLEIDGEESKKLGAKPRVVLHKWYCRSCDFIIYRDQKDNQWIPCPNCGLDFEWSKCTIPFRVIKVAEEEEMERGLFDQKNSMDRILKEDAQLRQTIAMLRGKLKDKEKLLREAIKEANKRPCQGCLENHPIGTICPPHEVRSSKPREAHFHEQIQNKDTTIEELRSIISRMEEDQKKLNVEVDLSNARWVILGKLMNKE